MTRLTLTRILNRHFVAQSGVNQGCTLTVNRTLQSALLRTGHKSTPVHHLCAADSDVDHHLEVEVLVEVDMVEEEVEDPQDGGTTHTLKTCLTLEDPGGWSSLVLGVS